MQVTSVTRVYDHKYYHYNVIKDARKYVISNTLDECTLNIVDRCLSCGFYLKPTEMPEDKKDFPQLVSSLYQYMCSNMAVPTEEVECFDPIIITTYNAAYLNYNSGMGVLPNDKIFVVNHPLCHFIIVATRNVFPSTTDVVVDFKYTPEYVDIVSMCNIPFDSYRFSSAFCFVS